MKNKFLRGIGLLLISPLLISGFFLTENKISASQVSSDSGLFFGQNHYYTVVFRGNGEAIVYSKIVLTNSDEKPLTEFSFEIPGVSPTELVIFQQKLPQQCAKYDYQNFRSDCVEYQDPDYDQPYYYGGSKAEYQKIQYIQSGNVYKFNIPAAVQPFKSTAFIVSYAAKGYVKSLAGLYKFNFETIKVPARIQQIKVAVDVDSDLLLKGKKSEVNYSPSESASTGLMSAAPLSSKELDRAVSQIGSYGSLVKDAKNLSPNESFMVKGEYAKSWFRLYLKSITVAILVIILLCAGVYFLNKFIRKRKASMSKEKNNSTISKIQNQQDTIRILNLTNALVGLGSAASVILLIVLSILFSKSSLISSMSNDPFLVIVVWIMMLLLLILFIFVPAIMIGIKYGWKSLVSVLIAEFLWFLIFVILYFALFQSGLTPKFIRYYMD